MKKRMAVMLVVVVAFIAVIGGFKFFQIKKAMSQSYQPPPEAVTTVVAKPESWTGTLSAIGSVSAVNGVTVSADLPGIVQQILFESGNSVSAGSVLVRLDTRQEQAQLASAEAQRDLTRLAYRRNQDLAKEGIVPQASFDQASAEFKSAEANIKAIQASIERKTIRAPFSGVLGIRQVNLGQYVAGGAPIVSLEAIRPSYVNFSVPQQEIATLTEGRPIEAVSDALGKPEVGKISSVDSLVDEATRNVHVQAIFPNQSGKLHAGMYVDVKLAHGGASSVVMVPSSAIVYAPFGDSVYVVGDMKDPKGKTYRGVQQHFVKLGGSRGDQVAITSGLNPGDEVVTSGAFKLRPGAAVIVNNSVQPANSSAPKPENS